MNEKIALVTCFLDNCGACLQAYALSNRIAYFSGKPCEIINYTEPVGYYRGGINALLKENRLYVFLRSIIQKDYGDNYKTEKIRRSVFRKFRRKYLPISAEEYSTYDILKNADLSYSQYVCGSDQIWNPTFYGKCNPAYYLAFVPDNIKKTSYAPSIGVSDLPDYAKADFKKYVSRFKNISVREDRGVEIVKEYADREAKWVCDPTMLLTVEEWNKIAVPRMHKRPYIFCYLFGDSPKYKGAIDHLSSETGLEIVTIPFSKKALSKEYYKVLKAGPSEFISLIRDAEYIITDSFHASVFSILFKKNFFTLLRNRSGERVEMHSRIFSLLNMLKLENRCISYNDVGNFKIEPVVNYDEVHEILSQIRTDSENFLKKALGE